MGGRGSGRKALPAAEHERRGTWRADRHGKLTVIPGGKRPPLNTYDGLCLAWGTLPDMACHVITRTLAAHPTRFDWAELDLLRAYGMAWEAIAAARRAYRVGNVPGGGEVPARKQTRLDRKMRAAWTALVAASEARRARLSVVPRRGRTRTAPR